MKHGQRTPYGKRSGPGGKPSRNRPFGKSHADKRSNERAGERSDARPAKAFGKSFGKDADKRPGKPFGKPAFGKPSFGKKFDKPRFDKPRFDKPKSDARPKQHDRPRKENREFRDDRAQREGVLIWGLHAARAAWLNPKRRCIRLWLTEGGRAAFEDSLTEARDELLLKRPDAKKVERHELDRLTPPGSVHQGIVLEVAPLHEPQLHEVIGGDNPPDLVLMLDQVTDPHNVGAILRSAAAFGAGAVIMTERNAPAMTGVQAKSASGALEHVPQVHVVNLARALDELQEAGYWRVGLAEEGDKDLNDTDLSGRTVLVLGAEGEGLRQLTRKKCDQLARLPTGGPVGSLNVSNAAAVALYEVRRQKK
ncbi:MAG TPA: 23S rRNA (guanosine(2251)-2'-O)-methyltransferase RlmB [Alphaproteobacteria bacterium]|nr:23S rRNA (guanosine(2251)-2'-O)-methyltransferase RlmB [Alphaproteobacteria bacterium]